MTAEPRLIALDWGTSSLRAYLLGDGGKVLDRYSEPRGIMTVETGGFAAVFASAIARWEVSAPALPALACGMIGSTEGWVHAPYRDCPAGAGDLAASIVAAPAVRDGGLHIVPGVRDGGAQPSVMRGEETQIVGALAAAPPLGGTALFVMPGTHSKWVRVSGERISGFATYLTGELFAVLAQHSILGRPARAAGAAPADAAAADAAFDRGVALARDNGARGITPLLFLTRVLVLDGSLPAAASRDFLSGLLIGEEVRSGLTDAGAVPALIGERALCARYARAFAAFGAGEPHVLADTAALGLWEIATRAGLTGSVRPLASGTGGGR